LLGSSIDKEANVMNSKRMVWLIVALTVVVLAGLAPCAG